MSVSASQPERPEANSRPSGDGNVHWFTTTHWTVVLGAGQEAAWALEQLCKAYWQPLYTWLRAQGRSHDDAMDLTQGFFEHLLKRQTIASAEPAKGRFRNFLLGAMKHFLSHEAERARAAKRGGGLEFISLDQLADEDRDPQAVGIPSQAEKDYDAHWARTVMNQARARLRTTYVAEGKERLFEILEPYLSDDDAGTYADIGAKLSMTEGAVKVAVHRLRSRFAKLVRDELAQTVTSFEEVEDELRHLLAVLRS